MMYEKKPMSLVDYARNCVDPSWFFEEDDDYIIYRGAHDWGRDPDKLAILIDRDAYFREDDLGKDVFFDMFNVEFETTKEVNCRVGKGRLKFGNFFYREEEPCFFLTEPKDAEDVIFYNKNVVEMALEGEIWPSRDGKRVKFAFVDYLTSFLVLPAEALGERELILRDFQLEFDFRLKQFLDGMDYRLGFLSS